MTDREKLIALLDEVTEKFRFDAWENTDKIADYLIANGVVVQRWIPVTDRLPDQELAEFREKFGWDNDPEFLVMIKGAKVPTTLYYNEEGEFYSIDTDGNDTYYVVTHWMSLPPAPKEVLQ